MQTFPMNQFPPPGEVVIIVEPPHDGKQLAVAASVVNGHWHGQATGSDLTWRLRPGSYWFHIPSGPGQEPGSYWRASTPLHEG